MSLCFFEKVIVPALSTRLTTFEEIVISVSFSETFSISSFSLFTMSLLLAILKFSPFFVSHSMKIETVPKTVRPIAFFVL